MICTEHQLGERGEPATRRCTKFGPHAGRLEPGRSPAVYANSRSIGQDNIAGAGLKESKPPGLGFVCVCGEPAHRRAMLGRAVAVMAELKVTSEGHGRVRRQDGGDGCSD